MNLNRQDWIVYLESFRRSDVLPESGEDKVRQIRSGSESLARTELFRRRSGEMEVQQWAEQHAQSNTIGKTLCFVAFLTELNHF